MKCDPKQYQADIDTAAQIKAKLPPKETPFTKSQQDQNAKATAAIKRIKLYQQQCIRGGK
jgi:hypothetical protein